MLFQKSLLEVTEGSAYVAGGVNSGYRTGAKPHPLVFTSAHGSTLIDADGNQFIDYVLGMGPMILGHSPQEVIDAAKKQLDISLLVAGQTPLEYEAAKLLTQMVPSAQRVRFASSGSEAVQVAFRVARAATARWKMIKFEGHYHGWFDNVLVSVSPDISLAGDELNPNVLPGTQGQEMSENILVLPWNNAEVLEDQLKTGTIAGIIMEPIMFNTSGVLPLPGYLEKVRKLATKYGAVLIFDEVITGFRVSEGGAQKVSGITPDMTILGKAVANGFPVAAIVGNEELMNFISTGKVMHAGTYNTQSISMAATLATLQVLKSETPYNTIDDSGGYLMKELSSQFTQAEIEHEMIGYPGVFNVRFGAKGPTEYRSALKSNRERYANFAFALLQKGVRILPRGTWFLSSAHPSSDLDKTLSAVQGVLKTGI
jgi:glutamate-1-semialdehyde 2,1-aminomutase